MIFYPLPPTDHEQCNFEEVRNGKMSYCGKPAVVGCAIPLCKEHAEYAVSMTKAILKLERGKRYPIPSKEFWEQVELNTRERARIDAEQALLKRRPI